MQTWQRTGIVFLVLVAGVSVAADKEQDEVVNETFCPMAKGQPLAPIYIRLSEQGNSFAQCRLGYCYLWGQEGVPKDDGKAVEWFSKAAGQGRAEAQAALGDCYRDGRGVKQDKREAAAWYRKAAEQGHVESQSELGEMYFTGNGVVEDYAKAAAWYAKVVASDQALSDTRAKAQYRLGCLYCQGKGVPEDLDKAVALIREAAEHEVADAQWTLGTVYARGAAHQPKDLVKGYAWLKLAEARGNENEQAIREALKETTDAMTPDQIRAGDVLSQKIQKDIDQREFEEDKKKSEERKKKMGRGE